MLQNSQDQRPKGVWQEALTNDLRLKEQQKSSSATNSALGRTHVSLQKGEEEEESKDAVGGQHNSDSKDTSSSYHATIDADQIEREMIPILKEGFLLKRKQRGLRLGVWNWQVRYCTLDNLQKCFTYGPNEASTNANSIKYSEINRAYLTNEDGENLGMHSIGRDFSLELTSDATPKNASRTFVFRAQDPLDAKAWVNAIHCISIQGKEWQSRSRRISHVLEHMMAHPPKSSTERQNAASRAIKGNDLSAQTESDKGAANTAQGKKPMAPLEVDVHDESKHRLKMVTQRIIARANERRREQQRKKAEVRQQVALAPSLGDTIGGPPSTTYSQNQTSSLKSSKLWFVPSCVSCMGLCMEAPEDVNFENSDLDRSEGDVV